MICVCLQNMRDLFALHSYKTRTTHYTSRVKAHPYSCIKVHVYSYASPCNKYRTHVSKERVCKQ